MSLLVSGSGLNALLSSEVGRLQEEVASLRQRVQGYEVDVAQLVATSELGHANPKQKIQYHLRSACLPCLSTLHHLDRADLCCMSEFHCCWILSWIVVVGGSKS